MRRLFIGLCYFFLLVSNAVAAPSFPVLTGRVVDDAHILSPSTIQNLSMALADYEAGTSNQIVVVTVPSLGGYSIEQYGVELGRRWQIGRKGTNNGVLLIVAPAEHEVRIEVGYGLEGVLTDAKSSAIINQVILPEFRAGHMENGIVEGTKAIMLVLGGKSASTTARVQQYSQQASGAANLESTAWYLLLILLGIAVYTWLWIRHPNMAIFLFRMAMYTAMSGGGRGSGEGGFSGGGGSFGGGGASGRW